MTGCSGRSAFVHQLQQAKISLTFAIIANGADGCRLKRIELCCFLCSRLPGKYLVIWILSGLVSTGTVMASILHTFDSLPKVVGRPDPENLIGGILEVFVFVPSTK
jgi:hypothetical protein